VRRPSYEVTFEDSRWRVRCGGPSGPLLSSHLTQQAAIDRAKAWVVSKSGRVQWRDRSGRIQGVASYAGR
jgi:hypothetical protein